MIDFSPVVLEGLQSMLAKDGKILQGKVYVTSNYTRCVGPNL
jgi:hypothetical protein